MWIHSTKAFNTHWKTRKVKFGFERTAVSLILKAKHTRALGTSLLIIPELRVLVLSKRHVGSGNEIAWETVNFVSLPSTSYQETLQRVLTI